MLKSFQEGQAVQRETGWRGRRSQRLRIRRQDCLFEGRLSEIPGRMSVEAVQSEKILESDLGWRMPWTCQAILLERAVNLGVLFEAL